MKDEFEKLGFKAVITNKGGVIVDLDTEKLRISVGDIVCFEPNVRVMGSVEKNGKQKGEYRIG